MTKEEGITYGYQAILTEDFGVRCVSAKLFHDW
jgi:hypothetical protein